MTWECDEVIECFCRPVRGWRDSNTWLDEDEQKHTDSVMKMKHFNWQNYLKISVLDNCYQLSKWNISST